MIQHIYLDISHSSVLPIIREALSSLKQHNDFLISLLKHILQLLNLIVWLFDLLVNNLNLNVIFALFLYQLWQLISLRHNTKSSSFHFLLELMNTLLRLDFISEMIVKLVLKLIQISSVKTRRLSCNRQRLTAVSLRMKYTRLKLLLQIWNLSL